MAEGRRKLSVGELDKELETDSSGSLFWKGKKVRVGGWSVADRIAVIAMVVAALIALAVNYPNLKTLWFDISGKTPPTATGQLQPTTSPPTKL